MTTYRELKSKIINQASISNTPVVGEFELTSRCNFACPMCYVANNQIKKELSTEEWKQIFSEAVEAGLVYALLTGGEALTRVDFVSLYEYLYDLGVKITVYTNGYFISDAVYEAFIKRPPELVAITLYGASNETYEKVTKSKNGFDNVKNNILLLKEKKIPVGLRVIPLPEVNKDLDVLIKLVKEYELTLGYFLYIGPSLNKDYQGRLSPNELMDFEKKLTLAFPRKLYSTIDDYDTSKTCAALKSGYFINHLGYMQACAMMPYPKKVLVSRRLKETFLELANVWKDMEKCTDCETCSYKQDCIQCVARRYLEGDVKKCGSYLYQIALKRRNQND